MSSPTEYLSHLRVLSLLHQNHHWTANGSNFYGTHLLFERLYQSAQENADQAAEKIVGLFGAENLALDKQATLIAEGIKKYAPKRQDQKSLIYSSLEAETDFLTLSEKFYDILEQEEKLTLGMDDLIMAIANKREEAVYLLKQTGTDMSKISKLARKFEMKLAQDAQEAPQSLQPNVAPKLLPSSLKDELLQLAPELAAFILSADVFPNNEIRVKITPAANKNQNAIISKLQNAVEQLQIQNSNKLPGQGYTIKLTN